jgi:hypothetical protein
VVVNVEWAWQKWMGEGGGCGAYIEGGDGKSASGKRGGGGVMGVEEVRTCGQEWAWPKCAGDTRLAVSEMERGRSE